MVLLTLRAMALGGMRDHIGGGFPSLLGGWRLAGAALREDAYDQAQLTLAYAEAGQLTGDRSIPTWHRHAGLRAARSDGQGRSASIRRKMPTAFHPRTCG
jgi:hypothetical protein